MAAPSIMSWEILSSEARRRLDNEMLIWLVMEPEKAHLRSLPLIERESFKLFAAGFRIHHIKLKGSSAEMRKL